MEKNEVEEEKNKNKTKTEGELADLTLMTITDYQIQPVGLAT